MVTLDISRSRIILAFAMLFGISLFSGCSEKLMFTNSAVVPGAKGSVSVKDDKNGNNRIDLDVVNLAKPELLTPPKNNYVVWMLSESGVKKLGGLKISSGAFSKTMKGSFETVTTEKPRGFIISAENNMDVSEPGLEVLRTK